MASHLRYARGRAGAVHDVAAAPGAACALAGAACKTTMYCWIPLASLVRDTLEHATMLRPMHGMEDAQRHGSSLAKMADNVLSLAPSRSGLSGWLVMFCIPPRRCSARRSRRCCTRCATTWRGCWAAHPRTAPTWRRHTGSRHVRIGDNMPCCL